MKWINTNITFLVLLIILPLVAGCEKIDRFVNNPVDAWAILAE